VFFRPGTDCSAGQISDGSAAGRKELAAESFVPERQAAAYKEKPPVHRDTPEFFPELQFVLFFGTVYTHFETNYWCNENKNFFYNRRSRFSSFVSSFALCTKKR